MSVQAIAWVLEASESSGAHRCVLIAIANHIDASSAEGWAFVDQLLAEANCSEKTYRRAVDGLVAAGELEVAVQAGGSARMRDAYRPNLFHLPQFAKTLANKRPSQADHPWPSQADQASPGHPDHPRPARPDHPSPPHDDHPRPSHDDQALVEEPSLEPSVEPSPAPSTPTDAGQGREGVDQQALFGRTVADAIDVLARRSLEEQPAGLVRTPSAWLRAKAARLLDEHRERAERVLALRPDATATQLADHLAGVRRLDLPAAPPPPDPDDDAEPMSLGDALASARAAVRNRGAA